MGAQLHETRVGQRYYNKTLPELVNAVAKLCEKIQALTSEVKRLAGAQEKEADKK